MKLAALLVLSTLLVPTAPWDKRPPTKDSSTVVALSADVTFQDRWYHTTAESGVRDEALRLLATCRTAEDERLGVVSHEVREASAPFVVEDLWDPPKDAIAEPGHLDQL